MRSKTLAQVEAMQRKAVRFVRDVLDDPERAAEIERESPEEYAARKRIRISENPVVIVCERRTTVMAAEKAPTKADLEDVLDQIEDLADAALDPELSREEVIAKVKEIADLAAGEEEEEGEDED